MQDTLGSEALVWAGCGARSVELPACAPRFPVVAAWRCLLASRSLQQMPCSTSSYVEVALGSTAGVAGNWGPPLCVGDMRSRVTYA